MIEGHAWRKWVYFYVPLVVFVFLLLFPFYWMVVTTVRPDLGPPVDVAPAAVGGRAHGCVRPSPPPPPPEPLVAMRRRKQRRRALRSPPTENA